VERNAADGERRQKRDCLAVRLRFPPAGEPYFVGLPLWGRDKGQELRVYRQSGTATCLFWPMTSEDVENIRWLDLFSVQDLKTRKEVLSVPELKLGPPSDTPPPGVP
jgi:hypothetical protein